jgi:aspartate aminotransferase
LDIDGLLNSLEKAPKKSVILLHACAHNPTGVDPTEEQWVQIGKVCQSRSHILFLDNAYQGYSSGDLVKDAFSIRTFAAMGFDMMCAQSFAKNFGLYGERIGALHFICQNKKTLVAITSQLAFLARVLYSTPPLHGARIVSKILTDKNLFDLWEKDLKKMSSRIIEMRSQLLDALKKKKTPGDWTHITRQIGMFTFTGLSPKQVVKMVTVYHVYMLANGRISMAGVTTKNVEYVANAIHQVVTSE